MRAVWVSYNRGVSILVYVYECVCVCVGCVGGDTVIAVRFTYEGFDL